jgi:hypothetical protein
MLDIICFHFLSAPSLTLNLAPRPLKKKEKERREKKGGLAFIISFRISLRILLENLNNFSTAIRN